MSEYTSTTCDLTGGGTVVFDVPRTESDDETEEVSAYEFWTTVVPGS